MSSKKQKTKLIPNGELSDDNFKGNYPVYSGILGTTTSKNIKSVKYEIGINA